MFPLAGGVCFAGCIILATYKRLVGSNKTCASTESNEEKCNKSPKIIRLPCSFKEKITFEMLNDPKHPQYIGHLVNFGEGGKEYNL
jgi:hypothetical protein